MEFAGINYVAVLVAGVAGFAVGSVWYGVLGQAWMKALGKTKDDLKPTPGPFIAALVCQIIMAYILAGVIGHLGADNVSIANGVISALFCWGGFVITTMIVNHSFQGASRMLTLIDGGHWLAVLMVMGAIIGAFGV